MPSSARRKGASSKFVQRHAKEEHKRHGPDVAEVISLQGVWKTVMLLEHAASVRSETNYFFGKYWCTLRSTMLSTLGMQELADLDPLKDNKRLFSVNDFSLAFLDGHSATAKLCNWVNCMFKDVNYPFDPNLAWGAEHVLYILALMLWTKLDGQVYTDLCSLMHYLMTAGEDDVVHTMTMHVFQKKVTALAVAHVLAVAKGIKSWLTAALVYNKQKYRADATVLWSIEHRAQYRVLIELAEKGNVAKVDASTPSKEEPRKRVNKEELLRTALKTRVVDACRFGMEEDEVLKYGERVIGGFMALSLDDMVGLVDLSDADLAKEIVLMLDTVRGTDEVCKKHAGSSTQCDDEEIEAECRVATLKFAEQRAADADAAAKTLGEQICDAIKRECAHGERLLPLPPTNPKAFTLKGSFSDTVCVVPESKASKASKASKGRPTFDDAAFDKRYAAEYERIGEKMKTEKTARFKKDVANMRTRIEAMEAKAKATVEVGVGVDKDGNKRPATFYLAPPKYTPTPPPSPPTHQQPTCATTGQLERELLTHEQKVRMGSAIELMPNKLLAVVASEVAIAICYVIQNGDEFALTSKTRCTGTNTLYVHEKVEKLKAEGGTGKDLKVMASVLMWSPGVTAESLVQWAKWLHWYGPDLKDCPKPSPAPKNPNMPIIRTPRCRFMYEILPEWRAEVNAVTSQHFMNVSYPNLPEYVQARWNAVSVEEKWQKYGKPWAEERDAIAKVKGKNWSQTSRLETAPDDSEDEEHDKWAAFEAHAINAKDDASEGSSNYTSCSESDASTDKGEEPAPPVNKISPMNTTPQDDTWWFLHQGDEPIYVEPKQEPFEEDYLVMVREHHQENQKRFPRPARIATMSDWPFPLPFKALDDASGIGPSFKIEDVSHKRSFAVQRYRMELEGVIGWMDLELHPFSNVGPRLRQLLNRNRYMNLSESGPRVTASRYHRALAQIRECQNAVSENDVSAFRRAMPVFCERVFADESQAQQIDTHLSSRFGNMLLTFREAVSKVRNKSDWEPIFVTEAEILKCKVAQWVQVIHELAAKADCIAVMVADALCVGIGQVSCENFSDYVFNESVFPFSRALQNAVFTDTTAPLFYSSYWETRPSFAINLEGTSRTACTLSPRARFADTKYTESLQGLLNAHHVFVASRRVDTRPLPHYFTKEDVLAHATFANSDAELLARCGSGGEHLRDALKASISCSHFSHWTSQQMTFAACTLLVHARRMRSDLVEFRKKHPTSERDLWAQEIYVNVDQAMELFDLVHARARTHVKRNEPSPMPALNYLLEARRVRAHWLEEDSRHGRHVANLMREERRKCKRRIADCVAAACAAVLLRAREADQQAELDEAKEALRQMQEEQALTERRIALYKCTARLLSWAPRFVRRKAVRVQRRMDEQAREAREKAREAREKAEAKARAEQRARGIATAIELNRAAIKRRDAAPARRAEEQKRWAKAVAKEAADQRAKEKHERVSKYKAEQEERAAALKVEAEEAERARVAREAKRVAEAAAQARIAAAAAAVERQRQQAEWVAAAQVKEAEMRRQREERRLHQVLVHQREAARIAEEAAKAEHFSRCNAILRENRERIERTKKSSTWNEAEEKWDSGEQERRRVQREAARIAEEAAKVEREERRAARERQAEREREEEEAMARADKEEAMAWAEGEVVANRERAAMVNALRLLQCPIRKSRRARRASAASRRAVLRAFSWWRKSTPKPVPPPPSPPPPLPNQAAPESDEELVDRHSARPNATGVTWQQDYQDALTHAQQESQRQLYHKCGWASGYDSWFVIGGWNLVNQQTQARQQHDVQLANFHANFKLQQRIQHAQLKQSKHALAIAWKSSVQRFNDKMAELDIQRAKLEEMDGRGAELERECVRMRDRVQARKMQLDFDAEAAATEQAGLSAELCERLRNRPAAGPGVSPAVDECVLCMNKNCTHIARACFHVIGCEDCCEELNRQNKPCPICQTPTTFTLMRLP